jgi:hypothetical protein
MIVSIGYEQSWTSYHWGLRKTWQLSCRHSRSCGLWNDSLKEVLEVVLRLYHKPAEQEDDMLLLEQVLDMDNSTRVAVYIFP